MIHFLRTKNNRDIIECSVYNDDLRAAVNVEEYSKALINLMSINLHNTDLHYSFIADINSLSEIRGWWWEKENEFGNWESVDKFVHTKFTEIADKYDLNYVTD